MPSVLGINNCQYDTNSHILTVDGLPGAIQLDHSVNLFNRKAAADVDGGAHNSVAFELAGPGPIYNVSFEGAYRPSIIGFHEKGTTNIIYGKHDGPLPPPLGPAGLSLGRNWTIIGMTLIAAVCSAISTGFAASKHCLTAAWILTIVSVAANAVVATLKGDKHVALPGLV